ncbi:hypothetical protein KAZ66_05155 [Candidatus Woesebacteria bacterium]|nr:hypothetical protein [Candidatus Woesebacteria bacterium]
MLETEKVDLVRNGPEIIDDPSRLQSYWRALLKGWRDGDDFNRLPPQVLQNCCFPPDFPHISDVQIDQIVGDYYQSQGAQIQETAASLTQALNKISTSMAIKLKSLGMALPPIPVIPTPFGTVAGGCDATGDWLYIRLPSTRPAILASVFTLDRYRGDIELLTHELVCHRGTQQARAGTKISDISTQCTDHWLKEAYMELLGVHLLVSAGYDKDAITLQKLAIGGYEQLKELLCVNGNENDFKYPTIEEQVEVICRT